MAYVPGYENDIFVSYAHVDDDILPGMKEGWVTTLIKALKTKLAMGLGRSDAYTLWMDYNLILNNELSHQIMEILDKSAFMLIILSPGYLQSPWCNKEKNNFLKSVSSKNTSRIFIIEHCEIELSEYPSEFQDKLYLRFWVHDSLKNETHILGEVEFDKEYYTRINKLSDDLIKSMKRLKNEQETPSQHINELETINNQKNVYLAEVTDDLDSQRMKFKEFLTSKGINILPEKYYMTEPVEFSMCAERDMSKCSYFIQLISEYPGKSIENSPGSYIKIQLDIAKKLKIPIFQWRRPNLDLSSISDEVHLSLLSGPNVRAEGIEEFKSFVKNSILKPVKQTQERKYTLVYVNMESADRVIAEKVCSILEKNNIGYMLPIDQGNPNEIRDAFESNLLISNGIIIIYGTSTARWVQMQILESIKILPKREQPLNAFAIFQGPPEDKSHIGRPIAGLQLLDASMGMNEDILEKEMQLFIDKLNKEQS